MRLRRILFTVAITLAVIFVAAHWGAPIALSVYAARKAPAVARVVPTDLKDASISQAPGTKLSYLGYEFEVPWTDLDVSKTKFYPLDSPTKYGVVLAFHSGRRMYMSVAPGHSFADEFAKHGFEMSLAHFDNVYGASVSDFMSVTKFDPAFSTSTSDYQFMKDVYEFTPDKMHYWSLSPTVHARDTALVLIKSITPTPAAASGIFRIQNQEFQGFQEGNPEARQNGLHVDLYSNDTSITFLFLQHGAPDPIFVTQPEINRIVQSLHKVAIQKAALSGGS